MLRKRRLPTFIKFMHKLAVLEHFQFSRLSRVSIWKSKLTRFMWLVLILRILQVDLSARNLKKNDNLGNFQHFSKTSNSIPENRKIFNDMHSLWTCIHNFTCSCCIIRIMPELVKKKRVKHEFLNWNATEIDRFWPYVSFTV